MPAVGTVIQPGESLAEIDGAPSAFLMVGTRPVWRTFTSGMTDGPDVRQLEQTLAWLGYGSYFTIDDTFNSGTVRAINAFEKDRGIAETGELTAQQVVFLPGPARVASQTANVGGSGSGSILTVTGTTPQIQVDLDASLVASAHVGDVAAIDLPNATSVNGTIVAVGAATSTTSTAQGNQSGTTTTTVAVTLAVPGTDLAPFDGAAVTRASGHRQGDRSVVGAGEEPARARRGRLRRRAGSGRGAPVGQGHARNLCRWIRTSHGQPPAGDTVVTP